jgi:hypothetical protein
MKGILLNSMKKSMGVTCPIETMSVHWVLYVLAAGGDLLSTKEYIGT